MLRNGSVRTFLDGNLSKNRQMYKKIWPREKLVNTFNDCSRLEKLIVQVIDFIPQTGKKLNHNIFVKKSLSVDCFSVEQQLDICSEKLATIAIKVP